MIISDCSIKFKFLTNKESKKSNFKEQKRGCARFLGTASFVVVMRLPVYACQPLFVLCMIVSCMKLYA